jgi:hypothetical protein
MEGEGEVMERDMTFDEFKLGVIKELDRLFKGNYGGEYIRQSGDQCWREMFDAELTPEQAAREEYEAAAHEV